MPSITGLFQQRLTVLWYTARRAAGGALSRGLTVLSQVRSCPYCRTWTGPGTDVCPKGHPMHPVGVSRFSLSSGERKDRSEVQ